MAAKSQPTLKARKIKTASALVAGLFLRPSFTILAGSIIGGEEAFEEIFDYEPD